MINLLLGAPGGGKSYEATVYHVLPALQAGRKVITNLPLNLEMIDAIEPGASRLVELRRESANQPVRFSTRDEYGDPWRHPESGAGPLYVIDEAHRALPRGATERGVEEWYAEHRHELADVILITQSYGKISKPIVDLVQIVYRVRKAVALGMTGQYIRKVQDGVRGEVVNTTVRKYQRRFFKLYRSHTKSGMGAELEARDIVPLWRRWPVIGAALVLPVAVYLGAVGALNPFPDAGTKEPAQPVRSAPAQPARREFPPAEGVHLVHQVPQPRAQPEQSPEPQPVAKAEPLPLVPYADEQLVVRGFMENEEGFLYLVGAVQNGQVAYHINSADLVAVGWQAEPMGPCAMRLRFGDIERLVYCSFPVQGIALPGVGGAPARGEGARDQASPSPG